MLHITVAIALVLVTMLCGWQAWRRVRDEPRRLANAAWIGGTAALLAITLTVLGDATLAGAAFIVLICSPLLVLGLVGFLLWNGSVMLRRESHSLGNSLSLLAGLGLVAAMALSVWLATVSREWLPVSLWIVMAGGWVATLFFGYLGYSGFYQLLVRRQHPDFIVALGSGLIGSRVPPLLASRIDRALQILRSEQAAGRNPVLVMSGGQGRDELTSEASAMGEYAVGKGLATQSLLLEQRSRTTAENLRYTHELVRADPRLGPDATGLAVTSSYHAMRAAILARRLGLPVQVAGAPTAGYFWPSAVLREFVAVLRETLRWQLIAFLVVTLPLPAMLAVALW